MSWLWFTTVALGVLLGMVIGDLLNPIDVEGKEFSEEEHEDKR